jgi:hypothetical protein
MNPYLQVGVSSMTATHSNSPPVENVIRHLCDLLESLLRERRDVVRRICFIRQTIVGLASVYGQEVLDGQMLDTIDHHSKAQGQGLTRACRLALIQAGRPLSAREVCDQIQIQNPVLLMRHKDPVASVNTLLARLAYYGEASATKDERGRRVWQWATKAEPASSTSA